MWASSLSFLTTERYYLLPVRAGVPQNVINAPEEEILHLREYRKDESVILYTFPIKRASRGRTFSAASKPPTSGATSV